MDRSDDQVVITETDVIILEFIEANEVVTPNLVAQYTDIETDYALYACRNLYQANLLDRDLGEYYKLSDFGRDYLETYTRPAGLFERQDPQKEPCSVGIDSIIEDLIYCQQTIPTKLQYHQKEVWFSVVGRNFSREYTNNEIAQDIIDRTSRIFGVLALERMKTRIEELDQTIEFILDDYSCEEVINPFEEEDVSLTEEEWESIQSGIRTAILIDDLLSFYNLLTELLNVVCSDLIVSEFAEVHSKMDKQNMFNRIHSDWSQYQREMFLHVFGIIDETQQQQSAQLRDRRNRLVHDITARFQSDYTNQSISNLQSGLDLIDELNKSITNGVIF